MAARNLAALPDREPAGNGERTEHDPAGMWARQLLWRYGVVFHRILERESGLPPWRDLLRAFRRLEARGEIRGGRFVAGFSGEQYALPEAVDLLRQVQRHDRTGERIVVAAADPLNLTGVLVTGPRVPTGSGRQIVHVDGVPVLDG